MKLFDCSTWLLVLHPGSGHFHLDKSAASQQCRPDLGVSSDCRITWYKTKFKTSIAKVSLTSLETVRDVVEKHPTEHSVSCEFPALKNILAKIYQIETPSQKEGNSYIMKWESKSSTCFLSAPAVPCRPPWPSCHSSQPQMFFSHFFEQSETWRKLKCSTRRMLGVDGWVIPTQWQSVI